MNIEGLIGKAKDLGLTYLRVGEADKEIAIELPGMARAPQPVAMIPGPAEAEKEVISQLVGYFRPVAAPGSRVEKSAVIGVIESLGLPNDVLAPSSGTLDEFFVSDGDAVEYGTVLARIKQ